MIPQTPTSIPRASISRIPDVIRSRFIHWSDCESWCLCTSDKHPLTLHGGVYRIPNEKYPVVPHQYSTFSWLRWGVEPQDHITTLGRVQKVLDEKCGNHPDFGFGIIVGKKNTLIFFDLDGCVDKNGGVSPLVQDFLERVNSYTEYSSSGTGLHTYVALDDDNLDGVVEYAFKSEFSEGKCYPYRFCKMTGKPYAEYDVSVRIINKREYKIIQSHVSDVTVALKRDYVAHTGSTTEWGKLFDETGIRYELIPEYIDKVSNRHGKTSTFAARIQCPNAENHTGFDKRRDQFNPDIAILSVWDDGSVSLKCQHHHCDPTFRPNLLQKLWDEIKARRIERNPVYKGMVELKNLLTQKGGSLYVKS